MLMQLVGFFMMFAREDIEAVEKLKEKDTK